MRNNFGGSGMGGGFPLSFLMPMMDSPNPQREQSGPDIVIPGRVNKAIEFLSLLNSKTAKRIAANDVSIQEIDGEKLCPEEECARDSALNCLSQYFDGKLKNDSWETLKSDSIKKQISTNNREGTLIRCIACNPAMPPDPGCILCKGNGKLFVQGVTDEDASFLTKIASYDDKGNFFDSDAPPNDQSPTKKTPKPKKPSEE